MSKTIEKKEKAKNKLREAYDYAQKHYGGIATIWKRDFISDADYQSFIRTYSYLHLAEVPQKFHEAITILNSMISHHAELVRTYKQKVNNSQLNIPMI